MNSHAAIEQLYNQCRGAGHSYVLLDPQAGTPFDDRIAALDADTAPHVFLCDALFADAPQQAPMLVRLPGSELTLLEAMAACAHREATDIPSGPRTVCAFIQSQLPIAQLAARLAWALNLKVDNGGGVYFRYFDPRVFHHLRHLLPDDTRGHVLSGVDTWSCLLWDGSFAVQHAPVAALSRPRQLRLPLKEWQRFETVEHFNATQRLFAELGLDFLPAQTTQLFEEVHAARTLLGRPTAEDTAHYLACSRQRGAAPAEHPAWPDVVELLAQDVPLAEALQQLCDITLRPLTATTPRHLTPSEPIP